MVTIPSGTLSFEEVGHEGVSRNEGGETVVGEGPNFVGIQSHDSVVDDFVELIRPQNGVAEIRRDRI